MDPFSAFLIFNVTATAVALIAFATMRESIAHSIKGAKSKFSTINVAGMGGAVTSVVLLGSVAHLFQ
jgi:hypothetical protein